MANLDVAETTSVELLLRTAEARKRELQLLCHETSERIQAAKQAAQQWRQIAMTLWLGKAMATKQIPIAWPNLKPKCCPPDFRNL